MAYLPDDGDRRGQYRRAADGSTGWILGLVVVVLLLVAGWTYIAERELMSAATTMPGAQSLLDVPSPVPPGERERRRSEPI
jgi:hypothetical protein